MQLNPYLHYNGNCEAAFKFYEKAVGAKIEVLMTHESAPPEMQMPPEWKQKIMHGSITFDGESSDGRGFAARPLPEAAGLCGHADGGRSRRRRDRSSRH